LGTMRTRKFECKEEPVVTTRDQSQPNPASSSTLSAQNLLRVENHNFFDYVKSDIAYHQKSAFTLPRGSNDSSRSQSNLLLASTVKAPKKYCKLNQTFDQTFINDQEDKPTETRRLYHLESKSMRKPGCNPYMLAPSRSLI
jgi:hypothetical protein